MNTNVDSYISSQIEWKSSILKDLRECIHSADSEIIEEWKWEVPVFVHKKMICAISAFKDHVKINFFKGALLTDKNKLINAGLDSKAHRSIDFFEGDKVKKQELTELIKEALSFDK